MSIYLVKINGWDPDKSGGAGVDTLFFGTHAYTSKPTDTPANTRFLPRVITALNLEQSMFSNGTTGGASEVGVGAVELSNLDGALDYLLEWGFGGRIIRIYALDSADDALADATLVFRGTVEQPEFSLERVTFRVRDRLADLDKPVQTARYRGDNDAGNDVIGIEGSTDIAGQQKPVTIGRCRNVTLECVCPQKLTYQAHDGPVAAIDHVYVNGAELFGPELLDSMNWDAESGPWIAGDIVGPEPGRTYSITGAGVLSQDLPAYIVGRPCTWSIHVTTAGGSVYLKNGTTVLEEITATGDYVVDFTATDTTVSITTTSGLVNVGEGGSLLAGPMDHANIGALEAADTPAGGYDTCLAEGIVRLGLSGDEVTADVIGATTGPNLAENGFFDDDSAWTPAGAWTLDTDNSRAVKTAGATTDTLTHAMTVVAGATYRVRFIVRDYSAGTVQASIGATYGSTMSAAGVYTAEITAATTGPLRIWGQPTFAGSVTAVDVRLVRIATADESEHHTAALLELLAGDWGGVTDLDATTLAALATACPQVIGLALADETTVIAALDAVAASVGAWWTFDPLGTLRVGQLEIPSGSPVAEYYINYEALESGDVQRLATSDDDRGVPCWKVNLDYQKNNTVQTSSLSTDQVFAQSSVYEVVTDARRAWLNAEYRAASAIGMAAKVVNPNSPEMSRTSCLDVAADAAAEAARLLAMYGTRRDRLRIRLPAHLTRGLALGDVVRVTFPRMLLASGKLFTVIGRTDVLSGDQDTTDLDIWG